VEGAQLVDSKVHVTETVSSGVKYTQGKIHQADEALGVSTALGKGKATVESGMASVDKSMHISSTARAAADTVKNTGTAAGGVISKGIAHVPGYQSVVTPAVNSVTGFVGDVRKETAQKIAQKNVAPVDVPEPPPVQE
jgi:hypothetical protein